MNTKCLYCFLFLFIAFNKQAEFRVVGTLVKYEGALLRFIAFYKHAGFRVFETLIEYEGGLLRFYYVLWLFMAFYGSLCMNSE